MVQPITEWADSVFAGHVLAHVEQRLSTLTGYKKSLQDKIQELEQALQGLLAKVEKLKPGQSLRFHLGMDPGSFYMGIKRADPDSVWHEYYQVGSSGTGKKIPYDVWEHRSSEEAVESVSEDIQHFLRRYRGNLEQLETGESSGPRTPDVALIDLHRVRQECLKYTDKGKAYKSKAQRKFPVDITGWKYVQPNSPLVKRIKEVALEDISLWKQWIENIEAALEFSKVIQRKIDSGEYPSQEKGEGSAGHWRRLREAILADPDAPTTTGVVSNALIVLDRARPVFLGLPGHGEYITLDVGRKRLAQAEAKIHDLDDLTNEDALKRMHWDEITVSIDFQGHLHRGGQWTSLGRLLEVDVKPRGDSPEIFQDRLTLMHHVVWHELMHVGQDLLRALQGMQEDAGLPSKNLRDPEWFPEGYRKGPTQRGKRREHELRDVEFYTDLTDTVQEFIRGLSRTPKSGWRDKLEMFVALKERGLRTNPFFKTWKHEAPAKWRKAVAEFIKAVEERVDIPGSTKVASDLQAPPHMVREVTEWVLKGFAGHVLSMVDSWIEGEGPQVTSPALVDLHLLRRECQRLAPTPKFIRSTIRKKFPIDLQGWRYKSPDMDMDVLEEEGDVIRVDVHYGRAPLALGFWETAPEDENLFGVLQINGVRPLTAIHQEPTPDVYRRECADLADTVRHELQHMGQDLLDVLKDIEEAGIPGAKHRAPGIFKDDLANNEFYPRLEDEIHGFLREVRRHPKGQWRDFFWEWAKTRGVLGTAYQQDRKKWEKAVAEFYQAVSEEISLPPMRKLAMVNPAEMERMAFRIERLMQVSTFDWIPGDEMEFKHRLPNSRVSDPRGKLPDPQRLRELARTRDLSEEDEKWVNQNWRMWIQTALTLEGLVHSNDPRNPRRMMRDMMRGRYPMASIVAGRFLKGPR